MKMKKLQIIVSVLLIIALVFPPLAISNIFTTASAEELNSTKLPVNGGTNPFVNSGTKPSNGKIQLKPNVKALQPKDFSHLSILANGSLQSSNQLDYKSGDIMILPPTKENPFGVARKISSISSMNGKTTVTTTTPKLEEVVQELNLHDTFPITAANISGLEQSVSVRNDLHSNLTSSGYFASTVGFAPMDLTPLALMNDLVYQFNNTVITDGVTLNGELRFNAPNAKVDVDKTLGIPTKINIQFIASQSTNIRATIAANIKKDVRYSLGEIRIPMPIAGVSLIGHLNLLVTVDGKIDVDVTFTQQASLDYGVTAGIDGIYPYHNITFDANLNIHKAAAKLTSSLVVGAELALDVYGITPAKLNLDGGVHGNFDGSINDNIATMSVWVDAYIKVTGTASLDLPWPVPDLNKTVTIYEKSWTLVNETYTTPLPKLATHLTFTSMPNKIYVGDNLNTSYELKNASGDPIPGKTVTFTVLGNNVQIAQLQAITDAQGKASVTFTSEQLKNQPFYNLKLNVAFSGDNYLQNTSSDSSFTLLPPTISLNSNIRASSLTYNKIKVSWYNVPDANGYEVYRSTTSTGTYSKIGTVTSGSTLNYTDGTATTGKTYYYKVRAYRIINGTKFYSSYSKYTSGKAIPSTPSNLSAKKVSNSSMTLSWSKVDGAAGYKIYRATSYTGSYNLVGTVASGSTLSFNNKSLTSGQTYYYKVRAYRTVNGQPVSSNYSTILTFKN